jgi:hypothetical protein
MKNETAEKMCKYPRGTIIEYGGKQALWLGGFVHGGYVCATIRTSSSAVVEPRMPLDALIYVVEAGDLPISEWSCRIAARCTLVYTLVVKGRTKEEADAEARTVIDSGSIHDMIPDERHMEDFDIRYIDQIPVEQKARARRPKKGEGGSP